MLTPLLLLLLVMAGGFFLVSLAKRGSVWVLLVAASLSLASTPALADDAETSPTLKVAVLSAVGVSDEIVVPAAEAPAPATPFLVAGSLAAGADSVSGVFSRASGDGNPPSELAVIVLLEGDVAPDAATIAKDGTRVAFGSDGNATATVTIAPSRLPRSARLAFVGIRYDDVN